jgi:DNA-directed RNA polymerase subunit omega
MNADLCKQALLKVTDPHVLINLVSRRVRQLTTHGAPGSRPLLMDIANLSSADIALAELIEDKMSYEVPEAPKPVEQAARKRGRKH